MTRISLNFCNRRLPNCNRRLPHYYVVVEMGVRPTGRSRPAVTLGVTLRSMDGVGEGLGSETIGIDVSQYTESIFEGVSCWGGTYIPPTEH